MARRQTWVLACGRAYGIHARAALLCFPNDARLKVFGELAGENSGSDVSSGVNSCSRLSHRCALKKAGVDGDEPGVKLKKKPAL